MEDLHRPAIPKLTQGNVIFPTRVDLRADFCCTSSSQSLLPEYRETVYGEVTVDMAKYMKETNLVVMLGNNLVQYIITTLGQT